MLVLKYHEDKIFLSLLFVLFIVFNQNLGLMPLLADEPTRALVSLEMVLQNNYIFPTLGNQAYLNKPPLFNWILGGIMYFFKDYNEWHLRLISIIPLFLIAIIHYIIISKEINRKVALWSSLAFLTCGRILFYDSMMAYIDPLFSLIILLNTYWVFIQSRKPLTMYFFIISYVFCLFAFFLKGLPAISFQACTLIAVCIYRKKVKSLVSLNHIAGIVIFLLLTAIYYYEYSLYANVSNVFKNIVSQSAERTPLAQNILDSLIHLVQFPIQFIVDFSPFSFFILFVFRKNALNFLKTNEFIFLNCLFIASNIWLYWISSETRARYLFMFLPMFFTIVFYMYEQYKSQLTKKIIRVTILIASISLALINIALPVLQRFSFIDNKNYIAFGLIISIGIFIFVNYRYAVPAILSSVIILIFIRITFNFYILPLREKKSPESINKSIGKHIGQITMNQRLYIINYAPINHDILYYLTKERHAMVDQKQITTKQKGRQITNNNAFSHSHAPIADSEIDQQYVLQNGYYICSKSDVIKFQLQTILLFDISYEGSTLVLAKK